MFSCFNSSARILLNEIGKMISCNTGEIRETTFLFQRVSVLMQRFNAIQLHVPAFFYYFVIFKLPLKYIYRGSMIIIIKLPLPTDRLRESWSVEWVGSRLSEQDRSSLE